MPQQLLKIHTTYGLIDIHTTRGRFQKQGNGGDSQPKLKINTQKGKGLSINTTKPHMEYNMDEVLDSVLPYKMSTIINDIAKKGKEAGKEAALSYAKFGWDAMESGANVAQLTSSKYIHEDGNKDYGLDFTPKTSLEINYTPSKVTTDFEPDKISIDVQRGTNPYKFMPGDVKVGLKRKPDVTIEYIGGFNRFPTGKAPKGTYIDKKV